MEKDEMLGGVSGKRRRGKLKNTMARETYTVL